MLLLKIFVKYKNVFDIQVVIDCQIPSVV